MHDNEETAPDAGATRRRHRSRTLKGGAILCGPDESEITCTIRNMHEDGAELALGADVQMPETFLLYVRADGIAYRATLRWRDGRRAGVSFHGTEPKPSWHYG